MRVELGDLAIDRGGSVLVANALRDAGHVEVEGTDPELESNLRAWARARGHGADGKTVHRATGRFDGGAEVVLPTGTADARWGFAPRGARVEAGTAAWNWPLDDAAVVWDEDAARIYSSAAARQWDPARDVPWDDGFRLDEPVEAAVCQVLTYLVENEVAALSVPATFLPRIHPTFAEVVQVLAVQVADEARHAAVFTRRLGLRGHGPGTSGRGGQASLASLLAEPDFLSATFLLSVLGEGSFVELLRWLADCAPDPVTRAVVRLAAQDEARHVAFAVGHLRRVVERDPAWLDKLAGALRNRSAALAATSGLNEDVFDALVVVGAGSLEPDAIGRSFASVADLVRRMDRARQGHLARIGFPAASAIELSGWHTRNFM